MYWTRSEKIIVSGGGIVKCDECPCPSYLIVGRCDYTWDGPPACSCDPIGAYRGSVSLTRAIIDESGIKIQEEQTDSNGNRIMVCVPIETVLPDNAYGHIYHALETSDGKPVLYCSMEQLQEHVRSFGSRDENGDLIPDSHEEYWGKLLLDKCPCACQYVRALSCGTLEDGSSEVLPYSVFNWPRQDYIVRAVKWNGSLWLQNPHYKNYRKTRYWLKECMEYPAEEVHGSDYLINSRLDDEVKRKSLKMIQLSPLFDTYQEAADWGSEWSSDRWARLICCTFECRCKDKTLTCVPAGYRATLNYSATVIRSNTSSYSGSTSWSTTQTTYDGHEAQSAEKYTHGTDSNCVFSNTSASIVFPSRLDNGEFGFPVEISTHSSWGGTGMDDASDNNSYTEPNATPEISFGYIHSDCQSWLPGMGNSLPGLSYSYDSSWPKEKTPFSTNSTAKEPYNYLDYWKMPTFDPEAPWPHGTWEMNYNETETQEYSYDMGDGIIYSGSGTVTITGHITYTVTPFFDEDYPSGPPTQAAGCQGGAARSAAMPPQTSGTYWRIYHQLSDDLKA